MISRRKFIELLLTASLLAAAPQAFASDDDGGGGNSGPGGGGGGNSGPGGGGGDDNNSGPGNNNDDEGDDYGDDHKRARDAYLSGQAASLKKIMARVRRDYPGDVVSVNLRGKGENLTYRIKIIDRNNRVITLRVNARTGDIIRRDGI